ncbi:MAG: helix-turn-helix transcriptional regulator, partial [Patescibacteria group bacterium]|nr:helix-turn-helix transcriptional regulator [Patescibacteria group bacterium]
MSSNLYTKEHQAIIEKLKQARHETGLDQIAVAKKLGKTQSYISKIESGQRKVEVLQLKKFARI